MLRFALLGTAAAVFARSAAVDWATCPPGWSAIAYDVHGGGKVWHVSVARIGECADMCRETDGCTAFEFSDEDHTCGTYTDGPRNIDVDHLEVANVAACALPRQAMLLSFTFDGARLVEGRPDGTLVEAVSFVDSFDQLYGARWLYHAPGSGFFLDLGRTLAVETHDAVNARFGVACPCHIYNSFDVCQSTTHRYHTSLCPVVAPAAVNAARASGYDTIQILSHDLDLKGARTGKTEFIDLQQPYIANPPQGTVLRHYYARSGALPQDRGRGKGSFFRQRHRQSPHLRAAASERASVTLASTLAAALASALAAALAAALAGSFAGSLAGSLAALA